MAKKDERKRVTVRVGDEMFNQISYWAGRQNLTINDFVLLAIQNQLDRANTPNGEQNIVYAKLNEVNGELADFRQTFERRMEPMETLGRMLMAIAQGESL